VTDSDQEGHYSLKSSNHRMSHVPQLCRRSNRHGDKFRRRIGGRFTPTTSSGRCWRTSHGNSSITMRRSQGREPPVETGRKCDGSCPQRSQGVVSAGHR
jgi:ribosomal protein L32E